MIPSTRFFERKPLINKKTAAEKSFIDVGGDPFHSLAVALIDNVKSGGTLPAESLNKILARFSLHFPEYQLKQSYISPQERLRLLVNGPRKLELITCLSYVLRQLTVDELLEHPLNYKEVFSSFEGNVLQDHLRQHNTPLPAAALSALAATLNSTLVLSFKTGEKGLPSRTIYQGANPDTLNTFKWVLQVEGSNLYFPQVQWKDFFLSVAQVDMNMKVIQPAFTPSSAKIAEIQEYIKQDNQEIWQRYERYRIMLKASVADQDLNKEKLLELYSDNLPTTTDSALFTRLEQEHRKGIEDTLGTTEELIVRMLIDALARALSTYQIKDEILDQPINSQHRAISA